MHVIKCLGDHALKLYIQWLILWNFVSDLLMKLQLYPPYTVWAWNGSICSRQGLLQVHVHSNLLVLHEQHDINRSVFRSNPGGMLKFWGRKQSNHYPLVDGDHHLSRLCKWKLVIFLINILLIHSIYHW